MRGARTGRTRSGPHRRSGYVRGRCAVHPRATEFAGCDLVGATIEREYGVALCQAGAFDGCEQAVERAERLFDAPRPDIERSGPFGVTQPRLMYVHFGVVRRRPSRQRTLGRRRGIAGHCCQNVLAGYRSQPAETAQAAAICWRPGGPLEPLICHCPHLLGATSAGRVSAR